jgi:exodeoxyribonuclease V alpha subunit|nr:MAG TPA: ATP dependent DNA helicase [Caudoviricetes sp.]
MENKTVEMVVVSNRVMFDKDNFQIIACKLKSYNDKFDKPKLHEIYKTITIKGSLPVFEKDVEYKVKAKEEYDPKYKSYSYNVISYHEYIDMTLKENQMKFFSRILTERQLYSLFKTFDDLIQVLDQNNPDLLTKAKGIGLKVANNILLKYNKTKDNSSEYAILSDCGLSNALMDKIIQHYQTANKKLLEVISNNPYQLTEVKGVGFKIADGIALKNGYDRHSHNRCVAFMNHYLYEQAFSGNSYVNINDLVNAIYENIGNDFPNEAIKKSLMYCHKNSITWNSDDRKFLGLMDVYDVENEFYHNILRLQNSQNKPVIRDDWREIVKQLESKQGWEYTEEQKDAVQTIIDNNVVIITGSAGSGKTASVKIALSSLLDGISFSQCALSGKAGVNLTQATGYKSSTIHRLLGYQMGAFAHNKEYQLDVDIVVVDEFSMVDANLGNSLIQSLQNGTKLIILGDTGQLEGIGVGNLLHDLVHSGIIPHVNLTKIHRQALGSGVISTGLQIRNGEQFVNSNFSGDKVIGRLEDLHLFAYHDDKSREAGTVKPTMLAMFNKFKQRYEEANKNIMDVMCLLPTKTSGSSCHKMNIVIQKYLIKDEKPLEISSSKQYGYSIHVGDKVICTTNKLDARYYTGESDDNGVEVTVERPIFNGNMGLVKEINYDKKLILIDFDGVGLVHIDFDNKNIIELGYCISVHRSQGSGCKYVICGLDYSHYTLLNREMVYTMITRTKTKCNLICETKALHHAIRTSGIKTKQTFLPLLFKGEIK